MFGCHLIPVVRRWRTGVHALVLTVCLPVQNAFPVSGQLYTTHLLSLEALLTVIDSTEAHCQAKVLDSNALQETDRESDTLLADGEGSVNGAHGAAGKHQDRVDSRSNTSVFERPSSLFRSKHHEQHQRRQSATGRQYAGVSTDQWEADGREDASGPTGSRRW